MSDSHLGGNIQNSIILEEHQGALNAKRVVVVDGVGGQVTTFGNATVTSILPTYSIYQQASLVSGYVYYGFTLPGSNPTTANFRILRETLRTKEVLISNGATTFSNTWSSASLASISYL